MVIVVFYGLQKYSSNKVDDARGRVLQDLQEKMHWHSNKTFNCLLKNVWRIAIDSKINQINKSCSQEKHTKIVFGI